MAASGSGGRYGTGALALVVRRQAPELQDCGANQTMEQIQLFGSHVRAFQQLPPAEDDTSWLAAFVARGLAYCVDPLPGPVHWNVPLREPLVPVSIPDLPVTAVVPQALPALRQATAETLALLTQIMASGAGAIVCGQERLSPDTRTALLDLSQRLRVPVFADVLSGLRSGSERDTVLHHPDLVVGKAPRPGWLLRVGGAPISRSLQDWLTQCRSVPQLVISSSPRRSDPAGVASHVLYADLASLCQALQNLPVVENWLVQFLGLDEQAQQLAQLICADERPFEGSMLRTLWHELPAGTPLFLANSLTIRAANSFVGRSAAALQVFANRGVSGIDGNIATACGMVSALGAGVAVVGDLALLHDLNALLLARQAPLVILLLDNGGGGIFDHLPQARLAEFEQAWLAPQVFTVTHAAKAFGLGYTAAATVREAMAAIQQALATGQAHIVHLPIERAHSLVQFQRFQS